MKAIYTIIAAFLLISAGCSSSYRSSTTYDDVYYDGSEQYLEDIRQEEPRTSTRYERNEQSSKYESEGEYGYEDYSDDREEYNEGGNTYITNNYYDEPYDYFYSSRIRRFSRPYLGFSYFGSCYTDYRWYDPYYPGVSIYMSWGNPGWGWNDPFYYSYRPYNSWYYRSFYDPFYPSFYSGYNCGYWNGFNDGFYYGSGFYPGYTSYGNYNGYNNYGYSETYTPTDYYYGPRFANNSGNNSGMRGQRSEVKYGKNDGQGENGTKVNAASVNSGQLVSMSRNGNNKSSKTATVGSNYFENRKGNEVSKRGEESLSGIRTVSPVGAGSSVTRDAIDAENGPQNNGALINGKSGNTGSHELRQPNTRQIEWKRYKSRQYNPNQRTESPSRNMPDIGSERPQRKIGRSDGVNRSRGIFQERRTPERSIGSPERRLDPSISSPRQLQERKSSPPSHRRSISSPSSKPERSIRRSETPRSSSPSNNFSEPSRSRSYSSPSRSGSSRSSSGFSSPSRSSRSSSGGTRNNSPSRLRGPR